MGDTPHPAGPEHEKSTVPQSPRAPASESETLEQLTVPIVPQITSPDWGARANPSPQPQPISRSVQHAFSDARVFTPANLLALQRTVGNRAVTRLIQRKLTVGAANDAYEQEADRVAEQVVGKQTSDVSSQTTVGSKQKAEGSQQSTVQRQGEEEEVQTKREERPTAALVQRWTPGAKPTGPRPAGVGLGSAMPAAPTRPAPRPGWEGGTRPMGPRPAGGGLVSDQATKRIFDAHMAAGRHVEAVNYLKTVYHLDGVAYTLSVEPLGAGIHAVTMGGWNTDGSRFMPIQIKVNDAYLIRQVATPEGYNKLIHTLGHEYQHVQQRNQVGWKGADTPADKAKREFAAYSWEVLDAGSHGIANLDRANLLSTIGKAKAEYARLRDADKLLEQARYNRLLDAERALAAPAAAAPAAAPAATGTGEIRTKPSPEARGGLTLAASITPLVQRQGEEEEVQTKLLVQRQGEEEEVQTKRVSAADSFEAGSDFESQLSATRGGGSPLPDNVRGQMEQGFGVDFSGVRVHTGSKSAQLNREVSAQAFTHGQNIYLGEGKSNLQSTEGQKLLAHELTHVVQQTGGVRAKQAIGAIPTISGRSPLSRQIQRQVLNTADIMNILDSIQDPQGKFLFKDKLDKDVRQQKLRVHVEKVLGKYQKHFAPHHSTNTDNAMMLAIAIQNVARAIAQELYDPWLESDLAMKLFTLYRGEIAAQLQGKGATPEEEKAVLKLTEVLTFGDPVSKYMHGEIRKEFAAEQIHAMAKAAGITSIKMFTLMSERFQSEMGAYTRQQIAQTEDKSEAYSVKEAPGQLSAQYYDFLFGGVEKPQWKAGTKGLQFTQKRSPTSPDKAQDMLDALKTEVQAPSHVPTAHGAGIVTPRHETMTPLQERHLAEIEQKEAGVNLGDVESDLIRVLTDYFGYKVAEARTAIEQVEGWLRHVPLTITVRSDDWFAKAPSKFLKKRKLPESKFRPATSGRTKEVNMSDLLGKGEGKLKHFGKYEHPKYGGERGERYMTFRTWKDNLETALLNFKPEELPTFGAVNVNWEKNRGTGGGKEYGEGYYGDTHFKLKRANVEDRLVYTATDHGAPHRDPLLALHDFAFQGRGLLNLKDQTKIQFVGEVVHAAVNGNTDLRSDLPFEIQIFGTVDIAVDVEKIYIAPSVSELVKANVRAFSEKTMVPYEIMAKPVGTVPVNANKASVRTAVMEETLTGAQKGNLSPDYQFVRPFQVLAYRIANLDPNQGEDAAIINDLAADFERAYKRVGNKTPEITLLYTTAKGVLDAAISSVLPF